MLPAMPVATAAAGSRLRAHVKPEGMRQCDSEAESQSLLLAPLTGCPFLPPPYDVGTCHLFSPAPLAVATTPYPQIHTNRESATEAGREQKGEQRWEAAGGGLRMRGSAAAAAAAGGRGGGTFVQAS